MSTGGDFGGLEDGPPKFEVGRLMHPSPIFHELLLLDVRQSKKGLKWSSVGISGGEIETFREQRVNRYCISV